MLDDRSIDLAPLGWNPDLEASWASIGRAGAPARVKRIDRGWSTLLTGRGGETARVRNIGADVAVGDWVVPSADGERIEHVLARTSAFVRRASFQGRRAEAHTLAANIDVVLLVHAVNVLPNPRRLERELVLAYDSGATPVVVLNKSDLVDDPRPSVEALAEVTLVAPVLAVSATSGEGTGDLLALAEGHRTVALLGASGVGKSTLVNALVGHHAQDTGMVREADQRGRHTTTAAELIGLPGGGWLIDTPGLRAVSLWASGTGLERAFQDVFDLAETCRFRDCKHEDEPGCAVREAVASGALDPHRLESLTRLVAEEAALEEEQREHERANDRRGVRRPRR